jgi:hypothetical protein
MAMARSKKSKTSKSEGSRRKAGRPSTHTRAKGNAVLFEIVENDASLREACATTGVNKSTFLGWVIDDVDGIADRYSRALKMRAMSGMLELGTICDDGTNDWVEKKSRNGTFTALNSEAIQRSKLRFDYRCWLDARIAAGIKGGNDAQGRVPGLRITLDHDTLAACGLEPVQAAA